MQHGSGMRIERDRGWDGIKGRGTLNDRSHYQLMPKVQPVKNAKCKHRWPLDLRVLDAVKNLHPKKW